MQTFYSADRRGFYQAGGSLNLFLQSPRFPLQQSSTGATVQQLQAHLQALFPGGLSLHGWDYVTDPNLNPRDVANDLLIEYVRQAAFPHRPSRLQAYFAFPTLTEVQVWTATRPEGEIKGIYELTSSQPCKVDQAWLRMGTQGAHASYHAHQYWAAAASPSPNWEYILPCPVQVGARVA